MRKPLFHPGLAATVSLALAATGSPPVPTRGLPALRTHSPPRPPRDHGAGAGAKPGRRRGHVPPRHRRAPGARRHRVGGRLPLRRGRHDDRVHGRLPGPADARKLAGVRWNPPTGQFPGPHGIEISVSGNAADFRLDDALAPLSQVDAAALAGCRNRPGTSSRACTGTPRGPGCG